MKFLYLRFGPSLAFQCLRDPSCEAAAPAAAQPMREITMRPQHLHFARAGLSDWLGHANAVTPELMSDLVATACHRLLSTGASETTTRIKDLIRHRAWTEAALALVDLELPHWQLRRIAYDEGEWYCALSRERELPDWLDPSVEARHPDL